MSLSLESRRKPIGNTFLNVCEVDAEQDAHFKREAVHLLPGRRQRRGHSISGAYIPFALRTLHGDLRRRDSGRQAAVRRHLSEHAAGEDEAALAPSPGDSGYPSPTSSEISPSAQQLPTFWPDTDSSNHSPSPPPIRRNNRARTAPPEVLASLCAHLWRMNQQSGAEGQQPASNEAQPIHGASQTQAPAALPALLGRERSGMAGMDQSAKIAELCGHSRPESKSDVSSHIHPAAILKEIASSRAGCVQGNASQTADQPHAQKGTSRGNKAREAEALLPGPVQPTPQYSPAVTLQSLEPQPASAVTPVTPAATPAPTPAAPPGFFATTVAASTADTACEPVSPGIEDPSPEVTTLMIRNLPVTISQRDLMDDLDQSGFKGSYDFLYMPSCFDSGEGKGFAFVNLTSVAAAGALVGKWHKSRRFGLLMSDPALNLSPAAIQGYEANVKKWNAPRMRRVRNPNLRPYLVEDPTKASAGSPSTPASTPGGRGGARRNAQLYDSQGSDVSQQTTSTRGGARKNAQLFNSQGSDVSQQALVSGSKQNGTCEPPCFQPAARVPGAASSDQVSNGDVHSSPQSSASQCANLAMAHGAFGLLQQQSHSGTFTHVGTSNQVLNSALLQSPQASEMAARGLCQPPVTEVPSPEFALPRCQIQNSGMLPAHHGVEGTAQQFGAPNFHHMHSAGIFRDSHAGGQGNSPTQQMPSNIHGTDGKNEISLSSFLPGAPGGQLGSSSCTGHQGMTCVSPTLSTPPPCPPPYPPSLAPPSGHPARTSPTWAAAQSQTGMATYADPSMLQIPVQHSQAPDYQMQGSNHPPVRNYNTLPFGFA